MINNTLCYVFLISLHCGSHLINVGIAGGAVNFSSHSFSCEPAKIARDFSVPDSLLKLRWVLF